MDLQQTFYLLGTIVFLLGIVLIVCALVLIIWLYYRYKHFLKDSKQKVAQIKRSLAALPFLPIVGYFIRRFRAKKKQTA